MSDQDSNYPMYALSEEHQAIREAVRAVAEAKIAPYAAEVDEDARYPRGGRRGAAGCGLPRPARAGGVRRCRCGRAGHGARDRGGRPRLRGSSLIPAVNKLGSLPVQIAGSEELKKNYLTKLAAGEGGFSYCLSEPDAGSDAGGDEVQGRARRRRLGAQRREALDHQRGRVGVLHRDGRDRRREEDPRRHLGLRRGEVRRGGLLRRAGEEARHQGLARRARSTSTTSGSPATG